MGFIEYTRLNEPDNGSLHSTGLTDDFVICKNPSKLQALLKKITTPVLKEMMIFLLGLKQ